jgi:CRISPR/Cas system Type II protein with McrA/HNH and RuvC-like nuclease domain
MWRKSIRDKWNNQCAYCNSTEELTIDHIIPQSKGGSNLINNVICCCTICNRDKAHKNWEEWYRNQIFFTENNYSAILDWMIIKKTENLCRYKPRRNSAS